MSKTAPIVLPRDRVTHKIEADDTHAYADRSNQETASRNLFLLDKGNNALKTLHNDKPCFVRSRTLLVRQSGSSVAKERTS
jgi:hypothetical protein